jgi:cell division protein FtsZ
MGIGRASGEDRATEAAQQAIESPLLEVSIDGARGILFNVIGGDDMTMHEINAAAETITNAADPDANIIFGATIDPDIQGELIITVVATGFDAAYYANRSLDNVSNSSVVEKTVSGTNEKTMSDIDMDLENKDEASEDFQNDDKPVKPLWDTHSDKNDDKEKDEDEKEDDHKDKTEKAAESFFGSMDKDEDDDLEKPSFLRRLKRNKSSSKDSKEDKK